MSRDGRLGAQLSTGTGNVLVVIGIVVALVSAALHLQPPLLWAVWGGAAAIALLFWVLTYRSRTIMGWIGKRLSFKRQWVWKRLRFVRRSRDRGAVEDSRTGSGAGVVWDGTGDSIFLELTTDPYEVTQIETTKASSARPIPVDAIREELIQGDIHCDAVTVLDYGHKEAEANQLAAINHAVVGPAPALFYGRTIVQVSVDMQRSFGSVARRSGADRSTPYGMDRTVSLAAERITRRIAHSGWRVSLMTSKQVTEFDNELGDLLNLPLKGEGWRSCKGPDLQAVAFTPTKSAWTQSNYDEWRQVGSHRQIHITRFTTDGDKDHVEMYLVYLTADRSALKLAEAIGLRREFGQQGDILTAAMPLARTVRTTAVPGKTFTRGQDFPIKRHGCGVGTYLGETQTGARLFANFTTGHYNAASAEDEPFYIVAPAALCQHLVVRLGSSGRSIDIRIPGDPWKKFAAQLAAVGANITYQQRPDADIIVTSTTSPGRVVRPGQVRLMWAQNKPARFKYAIFYAPPLCILQVNGRQYRYKWSVSHPEQSLLTLASRPSGDNAPRRDSSMAQQVRNQDPRLAAQGQRRQRPQSRPPAQNPGPQVGQTQTVGRGGQPQPTQRIPVYRQEDASEATRTVDPRLGSARARHRAQDAAEGPPV
ncbi:type VII secretion protein EccE [Mycobacteroides abscessus]|uniref:type VII secretion protein EccE n=1 Tax=Mycobacteroides abscessus TaxID=36809 RepID=UPI0012FFDFE4|nr:type VII secretion protein EccE [Mycobacteroides abscessus]